MSHILKTLRHVKRTYPRGQFCRLIQNGDERMFEDMFRAIDKEKKWVELSHIPNIAMTNSSQWGAILNSIQPHLKIDHSGSSFMYTLSHMNLIARKQWYDQAGWVNFILSNLPIYIKPEIK